MQYIELDRVTQVNAIKSRIRDLEQQHFALNLRISAPDLSQPGTDMDGQRLDQLTSSLEALRNMLSELQGSQLESSP